MLPMPPRNTQARDQSSPLELLRDASRAKRFAAMMYEGVMLFAVVFIAGYLYDTLTQSRHALMFREGRIVWLFIAIGLYFVVSWRRAGQTLPMKAWHLRIVTQDGKPPSTAQLLLRYALIWPVPLVGLGLIHGLVMATRWPAFYLLAVAAPFLLFVPSWLLANGSFLHDRWAGTRIVDVRPTKNAASQQT